MSKTKHFKLYYVCNEYINYFKNVIEKKIFQKISWKEHVILYY